jgi:transposase
VDQVHVIRYKIEVEGKSLRAVARETGFSRNTLKRYLEGAEPGIRQPAPRARPVLEQVQKRLDELLEDAPSWTAGKQRLTAARVWRMLREEGYEVGETVVKRYLREWKRQRREVFVPLEYPPGDLAQVDFFEVLVDVAGQRRKAWMFVMRLMHSGRDFAWLYPRQDQVCFLDGHVRAFEHFGCVPHRIAYDNLKAAVIKLLAGSEREVTPRFRSLCAHYVFEASFCRPRTGHDKGGVEARGKGIRWQHLVPIPIGEHLAAISNTLLARLDADATRVRRDGSTIAQRFETERATMLPLPGHPFRAAAVQFVTMSRRSLAKVDAAYYSAPCRWAGLEVTAYVGVDTIELVGPDGPDARVSHARQSFGGRSVDYRHYLPELARKPQALRQVAGSLMMQLGEPFAALWRLLVDAHGPKEAARLYTRVLDAISERGETEIAHRIELALTTDEPLSVALAPAPAAPVLVAQSALPESLALIEIESGVAADYDELIGGKR